MVSVGNLPYSWSEVQDRCNVKTPQPLFLQGTILVIAKGYAGANKYRLPLSRHGESVKPYFVSLITVSIGPTVRPWDSVLTKLSCGSVVSQLSLV